LWKAADPFAALLYRAYSYDERPSILLSTLLPNAHDPGLKSSGAGNADIQQFRVRVPTTCHFTLELVAAVGA